MAQVEPRNSPDLKMMRPSKLMVPPLHRNTRACLPVLSQTHRPLSLNFLLHNTLNFFSFHLDLMLFISCLCLLHNSTPILQLVLYDRGNNLAVNNQHAGNEQGRFHVSVNI